MRICSIVVVREGGGWEGEGRREYRRGGVRKEEEGRRKGGRLEGRRGYSLFAYSHFAYLRPKYVRTTLNRNAADIHYNIFISPW